MTTPSVSPPPMSIAVIGLGGIGSLFAYQLAKQGHDVTAIARPASLRLQQLQRDRGVVRTTGDRADMQVADRLDERPAYDLVIVTTLDHQVEALLPDLRRSRAACIHFMFNVFDPERLRDALPDVRCTFGMPFVMAVVDGEGRLDGTISRGRKTLHSEQSWATLFEAAGIPSAYEAHMLLWLRCHTPMCVAMESISVAGQRRGGGAAWDEAMVVGRGVRAGFAIVKGLGYRLHPPGKAAIAATPTVVLATLLWLVSRVASFRELLATGAGECRALIDAMATAAAAAKPPVPAAVAAILKMKPGK